MTRKVLWREDNSRLLLRRLLPSQAAERFAATLGREVDTIEFPLARDGERSWRFSLVDGVRVYYLICSRAGVWYVEVDG